jgi:hypothetical protein
LTVPTATSVRNVPMKLLSSTSATSSTSTSPHHGRQGLLHPHPRLRHGQALSMVPDMNNAYEEVNGKPTW